MKYPQYTPKYTVEQRIERPINERLRTQFIDAGVLKPVDENAARAPYLFDLETGSFSLLPVKHNEPVFRMGPMKPAWLEPEPYLGRKRGAA